MHHGKIKAFIVRFELKADFGMCEQCPLYPQKRTLFRTIVMSALCQKRTSKNATNVTPPRAEGSKIGLVENCQRDVLRTMH